MMAEDKTTMAEDKLRVRVAIALDSLMRCAVTRGRKKCVVAFVTGAISFAAAAPASVVTVDFESLPEPVYTSSTFGMRWSRLGSAGGLVFSSYWSDEFFGNTWKYFNRFAPPLEEWRGFGAGVRGRQAAMVFDWSNLSSPTGVPRTIRLQDGGSWCFEGAYFTQIFSYASTGSSQLRLDGFRNGSAVYSVQVPLLSDQQTFVWDPAFGAQIDELRVRCFSVSSVSEAFVLDDFSYSLVPAPGATAVAALASRLAIQCGRRRRDIYRRSLG